MPMKKKPLPRTDHPAPDIMTSADCHEHAATLYDEAAKEYRLSAAHYNYGDYQQANQHAALGKQHTSDAQAHCAFVDNWL